MLSSHEQLSASQVFRPRARSRTTARSKVMPSLFGEIDQARDMVMPGAFTQTLQARGIRRIPMLFQHDPAEPVGVWLELREDFRGLWARGRLIPDVMRAREFFLWSSRRGRRAFDRLSHRKGRIDPHARAQSLSRSTSGRFPSSRSRCWRGRASAPKGSVSSLPGRARARAERQWSRVAS